MSRQRPARSTSETSDGTDAGKDSELFNDVVLVVKGKRLNANGGILSYNSSILSQMISKARKHGRAGEGELEDEVVTMVGRDTPRRRRDELVEVDLQDQSYRAVKTLLSVLQTKYKKGASLSGETALQILPLTDTFKMKRLRKLCASTMVEELETMRGGKRVGSIQTSIVLKYLAAADKYNLENVKQLCVEECAVNYDVTRRKEVVDDKHISEKTKVAIMDKMCDCMSATQDKNLQKMEEGLEKKREEIKQKRQKHIEETEEWKKGFQQEVDDVIETKQYRPLYENLLKQFKETEKYMDDLRKEITILREQITGAIEPIEALGAEITKDKEGNPVPVLSESVLSEVSTVREVVETSCQASVGNIKRVSKEATAYFSDAIKNFDVGLFQNEISESYQLQGRLDDTSTELDETMQEVGAIQALYEQEKIQHEKTKAQLRKQMKKVHQINTWVKWAKPIDDDENRCTCFRHEAQKKLFQI